MDQDSTFTMCHLTRLIHTSHNPNILTTKTLLVTPMTFLVLVCAQNLRGSWGSCLQSSFTHIVRNSGVWVHSQIWKIVAIGQTLASATRQQDASPRGRSGAPFPRQNVESWTIPQIAGINDPPVVKTDTWKTENILTKQFLLITSVQACAHSH
jgi:hypothetical protein